MAAKRAFTVDFRCENSAFDGDPSGEVARILRGIAERVEGGATSGVVFDDNGNSVGSWALDDMGEE